MNKNLKFIISTGFIGSINSIYELFYIYVLGIYLTNLIGKNINFTSKNYLINNLLIYLEEKYPNHQFEIILGSDGFQNIEKWKNSNYIIEKYRFIVYERPGFLIPENIKTNFKITDSPQIIVSSTHIRELIKKNKSIQFLVPDLVKENIENNGLYK